MAAANRKQRQPALQCRADQRQRGRVPLRIVQHRQRLGRGVVTRFHVRDAARQEEAVDQLEQCCGGRHRLEILTGGRGRQQDRNRPGAVGHGVDVLFADGVERVRPDLLDVRNDPDDGPAARWMVHHCSPGGEPLTPPKCDHTMGVANRDHKMPASEARMTGQRTTREWQELDAAHHWHPFSDTKALNLEGSRVITRAEGSDHLGQRRQRTPRRHGRPVVRQHRLWPPGAGRGRVPPDARAALLQHLLQLPTPAAAELAANASPTVAPNTCSQRVLHGLGLRSRTTRSLRLVRHYWDADGQAQAQTA